MIARAGSSAPSPSPPIWPDAAPISNSGQAWPNWADCMSSGPIVTRAAASTINCVGAPDGRATPEAREFFISLQDDMLVKYGIGDANLGHDAESIQRLAEGQNIEIRRFLHKYESVIEGQRQKIQQRRQTILAGRLNRFGTRTAGSAPDHR